MHGIDFLKSCDTNVRVLQDVTQTSLAIFDLQQPGNDVDTLHTALATLREHQILCCVIDRQIWTFGQLDHDVGHLLDARFRQRPAPPSTISQHDQSDVATTPSATEAFLDAVEGAISFSLAKQLGMIRLCAWRWILPSLDGEEGSGTVLRMHAKLADPETLHIFYNVKPCLLRPVCESQTPVPVVLGCCGLLAKLATKQSAAPGQDEMQSDRRVVAGLLATTGVAADPDELWLPVEVSVHGEVMLTSWPARLCFTAASEPPAQPPLEDGDNWKQWFPSPGKEGTAYEDQLSIAEQWFFRASAGDVKSGSPGNPTDALPGEAVDTVAMAETPMATSSPFNQRTADLQAAMAGIYPTPPDGLLPGTTPSQHISQLSDAIPEGEAVDFSASIDDQPESSEAFVQPARLIPYHSTNEDLFGELGEMEMGANEVGDADFDYFDEPDDVPVGEGPSNRNMIVESPIMNIDALVEPTNVVTMSPMETQSPAGPVTGGHAHSYNETRTSGGLEKDDMSASLQSPQLLPATGPKPLSPFGIRERILPPPIPASAQQQLKTDLRRSSSFGPLVFNEAFSCNRHDIEPVTGGEQGVAHHEQSDIRLPRKKHKRLRLARKDSDSGVDGIGEIDISDADFNQDSSSTSVVDDDERRPPKLPWDNRERKRKSENDHSLTRSSSSADDAMSGGNDVDMADMGTARGQLHNGLLLLAATEQALDSQSFDTFLETHTRRGRSVSRAESLSPVESFYSLTNEDIVAVAQVVAEQATAASVTLTSADQSSTASDPASAETIRISVESALSLMLPGAEDCDVTRMAYVSDNAAKASANRAPSTPHPRPSAREGTLQAPSIFPLQTPHVHVQRGADTFDVLPTALPFWNALSLGPANGPKNAKVICMVPDVEPLIGLAASFIDDMGKVYEGRKLGVMTSTERNGIHGAERGVVTVKTLDEDSPDLSGVLKAYATASVKLGKALAKGRDAELDQTIVICMFNPFETDERLKPYLCACYQLLHKAYHSGSHAPLDATSRSDLLLQIVSLSTIAYLQDMGMPAGEHLIPMATYIYDRCPASGKDLDKAVSQSIQSKTGAPAIELATIPPKRIGFQLTPDPPSDILFDGSILHIAYASSRNGRWLTACWTDNTSHYQRIYSASLRGRSFRDVAAHLWEETCAIIAAKEVTWRVYIATTGEIDSSVAACWRKVVTAKPRKQMLHVTLVSVTDDDLVQLTPASTPDVSKSGIKVTTPGDGFSTPASTPQTSTCIASPDPGGQTNAPPTPGTREPTSNISENDPDVQLVDLADEHWGMLLAPSFKPSHSTTASDPAVSGLLIRRGDGADVPLETLSVNLHWDIRLRPNSLIDDGPPRQVEANLRETVKAYRSLSLMAKVRGKPGLMPLHISSTLAAAQDLDLL
ncbi:mediator complex subunit 13 C-terminal-domain-containing protein [Neohortaea acidophila]|uniref:Mediator of RNA polymerase II transcription subunit 13 n=1 Tax=Neohortaea acidophila TaxID=245834 RepID=A0A6A6Q1V1_9PEZI|nr:mediator complex subunit 13 C-terminal-domain-containing protein [Neohortaea acidophila]KAF2485417.1 mediator complex subunit 13 C-terminal-domain-containing protein [Neohortaea acidophila]